MTKNKLIYHSAFNLRKILMFLLKNKQVQRHIQRSTLCLIYVILSLNELHRRRANSTEQLLGERHGIKDLGRSQRNTGLGSNNLICKTEETKSGYHRGEDVDLGSSSLWLSTSVLLKKNQSVFIGELINFYHREQVLWFPSVPV